MKKPLPASMMSIGILGLIIFSIYIYSGRISKTWGLTFWIISLILFVASMISMGPGKK